MSANDHSTRLAGRLLLQCHIVGWLGVIGAVVAVANEHWEAGAIGLVAAAIAFGLAANAVLRE
jgi:EamA domain-containing membrane protein RarD